MKEWIYVDINCKNKKKDRCYGSFKAVKFFDDSSSEQIADEF